MFSNFKYSTIPMKTFFFKRLRITDNILPSQFSDVGLKGYQSSKKIETQIINIYLINLTYTETLLVVGIVIIFLSKRLQ